MATWNTDIPAIANQVSADIPNIEENLQELHDVIEQITNGTLGTTSASNYSVDKISIYKNKYLRAGKWTPTTTDGCAAATNTELATNDVQIEYLAFDHTNKEYACLSYPMPEDWDLGTIKAKFLWLPATGCSASDVVRWGLQAVSVADDGAIDATYGTAQTVTDTVTAATVSDFYITDATAAITVGGTPASGNIVHFKVFRDAEEVADTMDAEDAWLLGVWIQYLASVQVSSW